MNERIQNLQIKMEQGLLSLTQSSGDIHRYVLSLKLITTIIDELEGYLNIFIKDIQQLNTPGKGDSLPFPSIKCKASKSDITEAIVLVQLSEAIWIDGKPASTAQLVELAERFLAIDLKDFKNLDYANRSRKKDITPFAHDCIKKYVDRANRLIQ
jgi:hypothetical protein